MKNRLFVDMDGTLAVFKTVDTMETLYEKGYFKNLQPQKNVIAAVKRIVDENPDIEVYILSAYLSDSPYALSEKNEWLDHYLPEIPPARRLFVPCGEDKKSVVKDGICENDYLLDDYTKNLNDWQPPGKGIKLLNSINHTKGSWEYDRIRFDREPGTITHGIVSVIRQEGHIFDEKFANCQVNKERDKVSDGIQFKEQALKI